MCYVRVRAHVHVHVHVVCHVMCMRVRADAGLSKEEREVGGLDGEDWSGPEGGRWGWAALCVCVSTLGWCGCVLVCAGEGRTGVRGLVIAHRVGFCPIVGPVPAYKA